MPWIKIYLVLIINPYQCKLPEILVFNSKNSSKTYIIKEIDEMMEEQKQFVCALKGDKNVHKNKYIP